MIGHIERTEEGVVGVAYSFKPRERVVLGNNDNDDDCDRNGYECIAFVVLCHCCCNQRHTYRYWTDKHTLVPLCKVSSTVEYPSS